MKSYASERHGPHEVAEKMSLAFSRRLYRNRTFHKATPRAKTPIREENSYRAPGGLSDSPNR